MEYQFDLVDDLSTLRPAPRRFPSRPSSCRPTVLFFDFDGVLHCEADLAQKVTLFDEIDRLEAILCDYPEVSLVLSTSWQLFSSLYRLKTAFRPEYRRRIEGGTGDLHPESYSYNRGLLAANWIAKNGKGRRWIALDDDEPLYPAGCPNLIVCHGGFGPDEARRLREALEEA